VWAIATREDAATVEAWRDTFDIDLTILLDTDGRVSSQYQSTMAFPTGAYPQEWLIGADGIIAYYANQYEFEALSSAIEDEGL
jgi:hypothetical protein